ncbi:MAG: hypothetical protein KH433_10255, partial [Campylobacter concisus]|nr:hypothetical protein [Campylobacter concisus]
MQRNFHPKTRHIVFQDIKFNKFRCRIFRLDEAVLNFVTGVTEWVMTEQNLKPTKYKQKKTSSKSLNFKLRISLLAS